jgi:hypothetical protein
LSTAQENRIGEVIQASTMGYTAQCYELYQTPPLGSLVITLESTLALYGLVYNVTTVGLEPGRRALARGRDENSEEAVYRSNPQLLKLLRSEFQVIVVGFLKASQLYQHLPPNPARIHSFVYKSTPEQVKRFSRSLDFLNLLLKSKLDVPVEELTGASLRQMAEVYADEKQAFLLTAGKELAALLSEDYGQLKAILKGLTNAAA